MGKWVFRLAGIGLGKRRQPYPAAQPTEALVAGAAADLFGSLPTEYRDRLGELPELVARLEADAEALRRREAELERALAGVGTVGLRVGRRLEDGQAPTGTGDYGSVQAHRTRIVKDLDTARSLIGTRLTETIAVLENLRLGLLKLQAGVGTPDELTADLSAARELGREVQGLLDGERRVKEFLSESDASTS